MTKEERARQRQLISAFLRASVDNDVARVRELLASGLRLETRYEGGGRTALHLSAQSSRPETVEIIKVLIEHDADVHSLDPWGLTTVCLAARFGCAEVLEFFLRAGVDPNLPDELGWVPLMRAVLSDKEGDHATHVRLLIAHGANPHLARQVSGTAREMAAEARDRGFFDLTRLMPPPLPGQASAVAAQAVRLPPKRPHPTPESLGVVFSTAHSVAPDNRLFADMFDETPCTEDLIIQHLTEPLVISSGTLVGSDFLDVWGARPFAQPIEPGSYAVCLGLAVNPDGAPESGPDHYGMAFVRIQFADGPVARWEPATLQGQSGWYGFGVDHGIAAFFDEEAREGLGRLDEEPHWGEIFSEAVSDSGPERAVLTFEEGNAVLCRSGEGDGFYSCYLGWSSDDTLCAFLCDFQMLHWLHSEDDDEDEDE